MPKNMFQGLAILLALLFAAPALAQYGACGGIAGVTCAEGQFCDYSDTKTCGEGDQQGVCQAIPDVCTKDLRPVCGCDGHIYSNACMANAAGVSVGPAETCMQTDSFKSMLMGCSGGVDIQVIVCGTVDGEIREFPTPCAARNAGATDIAPKEGDTCPATH